MFHVKHQKKIHNKINTANATAVSSHRISRNFNNFRRVTFCSSAVAFRFGLLARFTAK